MSSIEATELPTTSAAHADFGLDSLPRAGLRDIVTGLRTYFRPGTHRSPLRRLGDRFVIDRRGIPTSLLTCSPEDAKAILADRDRALSIGQLLQRWTPHPILFRGDSLIFLEDDAHLRERRKQAPPFHGEMMKSYEQAMVDIAEQRLAGWPTGRPLAFLTLAQQFVLDVMRTVIFGVSDGARMTRLDEAMVRYCEVVESAAFMATGVLAVALTGRWRHYPPLERAAAAVDAIVLEEIAERKAGGLDHRDDCLTMFLELNETEAEPKDDATLAGDMRGLMLAGYETTAVTLAWVAEMLVHHPDVLARLEESIERGDDAYLDAVIAEVMRLRPAFPATGRRARRDVDLDGLRVPRGTMLIISVMAVHERADVYADPLEFRPERFLQSRPGTYTWLPFGGGAHRCLGASFALFESRVLMRTLLRARSMRPAAPLGERPARTNFMLVPADGGRVVLEARA